MRFGELQSHLCVWEGHRARPLGNYAKARENLEVIVEAGMGSLRANLVRQIWTFLWWNYDVGG